MPRGVWSAATRWWQPRAAQPGVVRPMGHNQKRRLFSVPGSPAGTVARSCRCCCGEGSSSWRGPRALWGGSRGSGGPGVASPLLGVGAHWVTVQSRHEPPCMPPCTHTPLSTHTRTHIPHAPTQVHLCTHILHTVTNPWAHTSPCTHKHMHVHTHVCISLLHLPESHVRPAGQQRGGTAGGCLPYPQPTQTQSLALHRIPRALQE